MLIISIALCTYNGSRYLEEQLESIARQTRQPDELVICDDGSTDTTQQIVATYRGKVNFPVRFHPNPTNLGSTKNFEQAISLCTGSIIALCDQDDIWFPYKLERISAVLEANPAVAGVFSNATLIDETGTTLSGDLWQRAGFTSRRQRAFRKATAPNDLIAHDTVTGATFVFRASFVAKVIPISKEWIHDGWIALILACLAELKPIPECLMSYRIHLSQQVGVRQIPWHSHLSTRKEDALASHEQLARRFAAMADKLASLAADKNLLIRLRDKVSFLEKRTHALTLSSFPRVFLALRLLPAYIRYQKGFLSLLRDILH